jgi:hypothetical protein
MVIRMAGMDKTMHRTGKRLALGPEVCISLMAVEQRGKGSVKGARCGISPHHSLSHDSCSPERNRNATELKLELSDREVGTGS